MIVTVINLECFGIIYKITNKVNGKVYIGQTKNGFNKRYNADGEDIERVYNFNSKLKEKGKDYNFKLVKDIEKYGFDSFEVIEVFDIAYSKDELDNKEIKWIKEYDSCLKGYNRTLGGQETFANNYKRKTMEYGIDNVCYIHNDIIKSLLKDRTLNEIKLLIGTLNKVFLSNIQNKTENINISIPLDFYRTKCINSNYSIENFRTNMESLLKELYIDNEGENIKLIDSIEVWRNEEIKIVFNKEMFKYVTIEEESNYTSLSLEEIKALSSKYELGVYMAMKQFETTGKRIFNIESCKKFFSYESDSIKEFTRALRKATDSVNKKLNYKINIETETKKKIITHINFTYPKGKRKK